MPDAPALVWRGRVRTYAEAAQEVARVATTLAGAGVGPGDRVLVALRNRPELLILQQAIESLGGLAVTVSPRLQPAEFAAILADTEPTVLVADSCATRDIEHAGVEPMSHRSPRLFVTDEGAGPWQPYDALLGAGENGASLNGASALDGQTGATILYTSGSSGMPKAAVRAPGTATAASMLRFAARTPMAKMRRSIDDMAKGRRGAEEMAEGRTTAGPEYRAMAGDRHLVVLPLYHATAQAFANINFLLGNTVVLLDEFEPDTFLSAVEEHQVAHVAVVPTLLFRLVELEADAFRRHDVGCLRALFSISAPLSARLTDATMRRFGRILYNVYGATELGLVTMATPEDLQALPGTIGRPIPGVRVRLLDEQGYDAEVGRVGELYAKSPSRMAGYRGAEHARETRDGFLSAGDLARCHETGLYECVGRVSDVIITGGVNVEPAEVEAVLEGHPEVLQAAVVGVADEEWGERVVAFVVTRTGSEASRLESELIARCAHRLHGPKRPRAFRFLPALPRNALGKIDRGALRQRADETCVVAPEPAPRSP